MYRVVTGTSAIRPVDFVRYGTNISHHIGIGAYHFDMADLVFEIVGLSDNRIRQNLKNIDIVSGTF